MDPDGSLIARTLYRDHCMVSKEGVHIKDLRVVGRDLRSLVLVDNAAYSFA